MNTFPSLPLFFCTFILLSACGESTPDSNNPPIANPVAVDVNQGVENTITLNGTDADSDTLSYIKVTDPEHGSISINGNIATYTPTENDTGSDSFTYKVNDGKSDSPPATVSITVLAALPSTSNTPTANPVAVETNEDAEKSITLNGTDADGDALSYHKVTDPEHGSLSINGNTAIYRPEENYNGSDRFTYKINDGTTDSNIATVSITVLAVNDAPNANAGNTQTGLEGARFNLRGSGTDIEGDTLTYNWQQTDNSGITAELANSQSATASLAAPEVTESTTLSFTLTVKDGNGGITTDTVDITINNLTVDDSALRRCFGSPFPNGVELYQLASVSCHDVDLSSADLAEFGKLPNLVSLSLSENLLSDINILAGMHKLTTLSLFRNQIIDLRAFSNTSNLKYLELGKNQISDISALSKMSNLEALGLEDNLISDITPLSGMNNLTFLALEGNQITDINGLASMSKLTTLLLNTNKITNPLPLENLTELTTLELANNQIDDLSFLSSLTKLTSLNLSNNDSDPIEGTMLSDISSLSNLTSLTKLDLSNNDIRDIHALSGVTKLTTLDLSNNRINNIQNFNTGDDVIIVSIFSSMNALKTLNLQGNQLTTAASLSSTDTSSLTILNLSNNQLNTNAIRNISGLTTLTELYLSNNQIETVKNSDSQDDVGADNSSAFSEMNKLRRLELANNKLITVDSISLMTNEFALYVQGNCIQNFDKFSSESSNINVIGKGSQAPLSDCRFIILKQQVNNL